MNDIERLDEICLNVVKRHESELEAVTGKIVFDLIAEMRKEGFSLWCENDGGYMQSHASLLAISRVTDLISTFNDFNVSAFSILLDEFNEDKK